ncbi:copper tolerance protein [Sulfitobacter geojensis]|nr:copper tolerance protein [Sulfitobacter geojensis]
MLFEPDAIHIESGSIVRFVISNLGALDHEFFLGSFSEVAEHKQWMRDHPDMRHDDPNAVTVQSGQSAELIWEFTDILNLEFVCLLPGHREAGMWGVIMVHDHLAPKSEG